MKTFVSITKINIPKSYDKHTTYLLLIINLLTNFFFLLQRHPRNKILRSVHLEVRCYWVGAPSDSETWPHHHRTHSANQTQCDHRRCEAATVGMVDDDCRTCLHRISKCPASSGQRQRTRSAESAWCVPWWTNSSE